MKKIISIILSVAVIISQGITFVASAKEDNTVYDTSVTDMLVFGDDSSENEHNLTEKMSITGIDEKAEAQYKDENGKYAGGGLGDGLSYRQILKPSEDAPKETGFLRFTLKADIARQNYITVRLSGNQYARGNIMLYSGNDDTTVFDPFAGREYSELDNGYYKNGNTSKGRYYYATMKIPQQLVKADGTVDLKLVPTGRIQAYGASVYSNVTEDSKYIYSIASHTEPYYTPQDDKNGYEITGTPAKTQKETAYEYLQNEVYDMTKKVLSWQCYGDEWEKKKTAENSFMEGAVIRNKPVSEADFSGNGDEVARRHTLEAINHQNWSTMSNLMIIANSFMFDFSKDYYHNTEMLDRYIKLLDFYQRAQDNKGGWCYFTAGEDKGKWLGVSLDGTGERLTGEWWPLLSLGVDAMMQSFIQLNNYIENGDNEEFKNIWDGYLDEIIDGDLTGRNDKTRRDYYMDMFGRLRDRLANPERGVGDFYAPTNRSGTANQDFGFAYSANKAMELLGETENSSYEPNDEKQYTDMIDYKYGEMADGEKWFSDENTLGLEYGVSHGGWAGDYGPLLIEITNKYAESAQYFDKETKALFDKTADGAYESAKYFFYPSVDSNGENVLTSEVYASARNNGYGLKISYPVAGYTATKLNSQGALAFLAQYIRDNRGYSDTLRADIESNTPHVYTRIVDSQEILKYYKEVEKLDKAGKIEPLPMDDKSEDFVFFDADAQAMVFKNNGDKGYITFNYRRDSWKYNDNTRIHLMSGDAERIVDVKGSHQGDVYSWQDSSHKSEAGAPYTHTRYDGMVETRYGKYIAAINQSKTDSEAGQTGKTYTLEDAIGVTKAKDLISGKVYEDKNGIKVEVAPRGAVLLEILETAEAVTVGAVYEVDGKILDSDTKTILKGEKILFEAPIIDGYSLTDGQNKSAEIAAIQNENTVFLYKSNGVPEFTAKNREVKDAGWKVMNYGSAQGELKEDNGKFAISSVCPSGEGNLMKTFAYKEVSGDFEIHARLTGFDSTSYDSDYFGIMATDNLDLYNANFFEERHFSNNNNILMVTHTEGQEKSTTSSWAGDMNGKNVPIDFVIRRTGNVIEYWFSLDEGKTYQQTSKPKVTLNADDVMYVGFCMTAQKEITNTAHVEDVTLTGEMVGADIQKGETVELDFSVNDKENDDIEFSFTSELPEGAVRDGYKIYFTPVRGGEYVFRAEARDKYHKEATVKTVKVNVAPVISLKLDGIYIKSDVSSYIENNRTMVPIRVISESLGANVDWNEETKTVTVENDENKIELTIGSKTAVVNGKNISLDAPAVIQQSRTFVPVRFVAEQLGWGVDWNQDSYTVNIKK